MRRRTLILVATLAAMVMPRGLRAQDATKEGYYEAAVAWATTVMVDHDYETAASQAHPDVASQLSASVLENAWGQLSAQLGELVSLAPHDQFMEQGFHIVVLTGVFDAGTFNVQVVMGDAYGVAGFFVRPPEA